MTETRAAAAPPDAPGRILDIIGASLTLGTPVILMAITAIPTGGTEYVSPWTAWDAVGRVAVFLVPALIAVVAVWLPHALRGAVWLGVGIALSLVAVAMFVLVAPIFLPGPILLIVGGAQARAAGPGEVTLMVAIVVGALLSLAATFFAFPDTEACVEGRTPSGVHTSCRGDVVTRTEALTGATPWAVVAVWVWLAARRRR